MRRERRVDGQRQVHRPEAVVEPRVLQVRCHHAERFNPERLQLLGARGHLRDRAPAERAVQPAEQPEKQPLAVAIIRERDAAIRLNRRQREIRRAIAGLQQAFKSERHKSSSTQEGQHQQGIGIDPRVFAELLGLLHVLLGQFPVAAMR